MNNWGVLSAILLAIFFCAGCATNPTSDVTDRIKNESTEVMDAEAYKNELFHDESIDENLNAKRVSPIYKDSNHSLSTDSKRKIKPEGTNEISKRSNNDKKNHSDQGSGIKKQKNYDVEDVTRLPGLSEKPAQKQKKGPSNQQNESSIQSYFSSDRPSHGEKKKINENKRTEEIESGINRDLQNGNGLKKNLPLNTKNNESLIGSLNTSTNETAEKGDQDYLEIKSVGYDDSRSNKSNFSSGAKISKFDDSDTDQKLDGEIDRIKSVEFNDYIENSEKKDNSTWQKVGFGEFKRESVIEFDRDAKSNLRIKNAQKENQFNRIRSFLQRNDDLRMSEGVNERSSYSNAKEFIDTDRSGTNESITTNEGKQGGAKYGKTLEWIEKRGKVKQSKKLNE